MIPQETVQLILDTARVEDVVGDFVTLKRRGSSLWACCPFHNEKTPSFHVEPSRGIYKCFGCGKSGTAVGFIMEYEKLSYTEALKYLARKYHIEVKEKEESAEDIAARQRNESLLAVSEFAFNFYKDQLATDEGRAVAVQYFHSRGLEDETIAKYGLGWAPKSKNALTEAAKKEGYKDEYLLETGLCAQWDTDGSLHDRFYDRVMFPIHSVSGRVIAFPCTASISPSRRFPARTSATSWKGTWTSCPCTSWASPTWWPPAVLPLPWSRSASSSGSPRTSPSCTMAIRPASTPPSAGST